MNCPRCGTPMQGGICPECGFPVNRLRMEKLLQGFFTHCTDGFFLYTRSGRFLYSLSRLYPLRYKAQKDLDEVTRTGIKLHHEYDRRICKTEEKRSGTDTAGIRYAVRPRSPFCPRSGAGKRNRAHGQGQSGPQNVRNESCPGKDG